MNAQVTCCCAPCDPDGTPTLNALVENLTATCQTLVIGVAGGTSTAKGSYHFADTLPDGNFCLSYFGDDPRGFGGCVYRAALGCFTIDSYAFSDTCGSGLHSTFQVDLYIFAWIPPSGATAVVITSNPFGLFGSGSLHVQLFSSGFADTTPDGHAISQEDACPPGDTFVTHVNPVGDGAVPVKLACGGTIKLTADDCSLADVTPCEDSDGDCYWRFKVIYDCVLGRFREVVFLGAICSPTDITTDGWDDPVQSTDPQLHCIFTYGQIMLAGASCVDGSCNPPAADDYPDPPEEAPDCAGKCTYCQYEEEATPTCPGDPDATHADYDIAVIAVGCATAGAHSTDWEVSGTVSIGGDTLNKYSRWVETTRYCSNADGCTSPGSRHLTSAEGVAEGLAEQECPVLTGCPQPPDCTGPTTATLSNLQGCDPLFSTDTVVFSLTWGTDIDLGCSASGFDAGSGLSMTAYCTGEGEGTYFAQVSGGFDNPEFSGGASSLTQTSGDCAGTGDALTLSLA